MKTKHTLAAIGGAGLAALIVATSAAQAHTAKYEKLQSVKTDMQAALVLAKAAVPGNVMEAELERHRGQMVWEIKILDENQQRTKLKLDSETGDVLKQKTRKKSSRHAAPAISIEQAIEAAGIVEGSLLIEAELERKDDRMVWEIESIGPDDTKSEVYVDAETGESI